MVMIHGGHDWRNRLDQHAFNRRAWIRAMARDPCDVCGKIMQHHHATCLGVALCHDCCSKLRPCVQCYPGDEGGAIGPYPYLITGIIQSG